MNTQQQKFYIIADDVTAFGIGQTKDEALENAVNWVINPITAQHYNYALNKLRSIAQSRDAYKRNPKGVYIAEIDCMHYPANAKDLMAEELCAIIKKQDRVQS